jgi:hypothetical protein
MRKRCASRTFLLEGVWVQIAAAPSIHFCRIFWERRKLHPRGNPVGLPHQTLIFNFNFIKSYRSLLLLSFRLPAPKTIFLFHVYHQ